MMELQGNIIEVQKLNVQDKKVMFSLMEEFYDDTSYPVFLKDLEEKDYCILLFDKNNRIKGFSTQKIISVTAAGEKVYGVFSGDTIIHRKYWGSIELYRIFAQYFIKYGRQYRHFYWFLISKGYKTYKMLPLFFREFYPNYVEKTPAFEHELIHAFGITKYPEEYRRECGVIQYKGTKDKLKPGVADITEKQLRDLHILHFLKLNPGYINGNDLVCVAKLSEENLKPAVRRLLLGCD